MILKLKIIVLSILLYVGHSVFAQTSIDSAGRRLSYYHNYFVIDTLEFHSKKLTALHTLEKTKYIKDKMFRMGDLIFNDSVNKISKLHLINEHYVTTTISTVPINDIIIDDAKELIICLSRAEISPYHIVLYNFKGALLFKKKMLPLELVLDSINYVLFKNSFPAFYEYAKFNKQILQQTNNLYYIDLDYWHFLSENEKEIISELGWLKTSHYFPLHAKCFDCTPPYKLSQYTNFYSQTDPFYDYEYQNGKIVGIILNDEYGGKVKITIILD